MPCSDKPPGNQELVIQSSRVLTTTGERSAALHLVEGKIAKIEPCGDCESHLTVLPGLVDTHVHLNEPGNTEWEGFATGTAAAAAGGITTLVDMPLNSLPVTTTLTALEAKRKAAADQLSVDVGFYAGLVPGNAAQLRLLLDAEVLGVKAFLCPSGIDEFPAATERELREAMPLLADRGALLLVHAEQVSLADSPSDPRRYDDYLRTRPPRFERDAIGLLIDLCRETGCRTHVVHLADAGSLPMIAAARTEGLPLTVETCPHYLTFCAEEIAAGDTRFKCAPPIRDAANREALWEGLSEGVIDFIASDHSPCPPTMKSLDSGRFDEAWGGISSLQLMLPVVWTEAARRGHSLSRVVDWLCHRPAKLVGLDAGIRVGAPANLILFDPNAEHIVQCEQLTHRHKVTPYEGRRLRGDVKATYLRGKPPFPGAGRAL